MPELEILTGPRAGQRVAVEAPLMVGRAEADLELADGEVSRHHAILRARESGGLEVEDLASTNGTWIDDTRVDGRAALPSEASLRIGATVMRLAPAPVAAAPRGDPAPSAATFRPPTVRRRHGQRSAALLLGPTIVSLLVVVATAAALVVYFATR